MSQLDNSMSFDFKGQPPAKSADNKTSFSSPAGDADPTVYNGSDNQEDFSQDSSGVPSDGGPSTKTDMALTLEGNKFPRQKGHDSLSEENAQLS